MARSLHGCVALVTGGTRGIGAAIAAKLAEDGAEVTVTGTTPKGPFPAGCKFHVVDFSDRAATEAFAAEVADREVDILVNNAGINKIGPFAQTDPKDFDRIQEVNVRAPFLLCRAVLPSMIRKGWGRITNISSLCKQVCPGWHDLGACC